MTSRPVSGIARALPKLEGFVDSRMERTRDVVAAWLRRSSGPRVPSPTPADRQPERWPASLPFRQRPKPFTRSILWVPESTQTSSIDRSEPYELFVCQAVLRDVRAHLIGARSSEPYGFLLGHVVYCPWSETAYVVIDSVRRETEDVPHGGDIDQFRHAWASASRDARRRRGQVIGWYHRHGVLGIRLSEWDLRLQDEFFPDPWHCSLVVAPTSSGVSGGFLQRSARARLYRKGLVSFHELIDLDAKRISGRRPSLVDWNNYHTSEAVEVMRGEWPAPAARQGDPPPAPAPADDSSARSGGKKLVEASDSTPRMMPRPRRAWKSVSRTENEPEKDRQILPGPAERAAAARASEVDGAAGTAADRKRKKAARQARPRQARAPSSADVGQFLDAVWGPPPFEAEDADDYSGLAPLLVGFALDPAEAEATARPVDVSPIPTIVTPERTASLAVLARLPSSATPSEWMEADIARVATADANAALEPARRWGVEPPEVDQAPGSLEWLLPLIGESARGAVPPAAEAHPAAATEPPPTGDAEAAPQPTRLAEPVEVSTGPVQGSGGRPPPVRFGRSAVVGATSANPDEDPEAEIPVVMPGEDPMDVIGWLHRNRLAAAAGVVLALIGLAAVLLGGGEEPVLTTFERPPIDVARPAPQAPVSTRFETLTRDFEARITSYRERSADFELGRLDCIGLATGFGALQTAFRELSEEAARLPSTAGAYTELAARMQSARGHFQGSGCAPPGATSSSPTAGSSPS